LIEGFDDTSVHLFVYNGKRLALDVNSGSILNLDEPSFYFINELLRYGSSNIASARLREKFGDDSQEILNEMEELISGEILFSKPIPYFESTLTLKSMCLNVAHSCNFACKYCFAKKGSYGNSEELMSPEIAKKAIDFLTEASGGNSNLEVDFFGGEPLLAYNTVKETIIYTKREYPDKKWRFTITTNGSFLDEEKEKFLYQNDVSMVLSLDGDKNTNDKFRVLKDGAGTFDMVFPKIKDIADHRSLSEGYYIRGTYTKENLEISKTVMDLRDMGYKFISLEPVVSKDEISITEEDLVILKSEYEKLAKKYIESQKEGEWKFFHFNLDLEAGPCVQKRVNGCGAGVEYIAISPSGDIYPCHQFDGVREAKLGNINTGIINKELQEQFRKENYLFNKDKCKKCWAKFYCGGGCLANNYNINGSIAHTYSIGCEIQKMRIEAALYVYSELSKK
jgi:uncharacterized protein